MPSHYCRSTSSKKYLDPDIKSRAKLYGLFKEYCQQNGKPIPSRNILSSEFTFLNLGFFQPKKDRCDTCCGYETTNIEEEVYQQHVAKKERARIEKRNDKEACQNQGSDVSVWTMDLQAVLLAPRLLASALYYKTKLAVHNFTMYNLKNGNVICYVWNESEGEITANNFASCLINFLENLIKEEPHLKTIILYSDGCGYQNRNTLLSNAILYFTQKYKITVIQKYLEKGHTQMEVDSVHSTIERQIGKRSIFYPGDYISIMQECRPSKPYKIHELTYEFFKDFRHIKFVESIRPGKVVGDKQVHDMKAIKYSNGQLLYKCDYSEEWQVLPQRMKENKGEILPLYQSRMKIKKSKYDHLQQLKTVIPPVFHAYYDMLPHY